MIPFVRVYLIAKSLNLLHKHLRSDHAQHAIEESEKLVVCLNSQIISRRKLQTFF